MGHTSDPRFLTFHALRIKGFAKADVRRRSRRRSPIDDVEQHLVAMQDEGAHDVPRGAGLWQLTPDGSRPSIAERLAADVEASGASPSSSRGPYARVPRPERAVQGAVRRLAAAQRRTRTTMPTQRTTVRSIARLRQARRRGAAGRRRASAPSLDAPRAVRAAPGSGVPARGRAVKRICSPGVMCGSYHDVWMELHEDLILTQGIDRARGGQSF